MVRLFASFGFIFFLNIFVIDDTATTKEVVITGFQLWQSQRFNRRITLMQEKFCFGGISDSVFVRFAFARLGSAWCVRRIKQIICIRRYGTAVY